MKRFILTIVILLYSMVSFGQVELSGELKFCWGEFASEPYIFTTTHRPPNFIGEVKGGIIHDIAIEISREFKTRLIWVYTSRNRLISMLEENICDLYIGLAQEWEFEADVEWTKPLWDEEFRYFHLRKNKYQLERLGDIQGLQVGTVLGFKYDKVDKMASIGLIRKEVSPTTEIMLKMLLAERVGVVVSNYITTKWLEKKLKFEPFEHSRYLDSSVPIRIAVSRHSYKSMVEINRVTWNLRESGKIEEIISTYGKND